MTVIKELWLCTVKNCSFFNTKECFISKFLSVVLHWMCYVQKFICPAHCSRKDAVMFLPFSTGSCWSFKEFVKALLLGQFYFSIVFTVLEGEHDSWSSRKCIMFLPDDYGGENLNVLSILKKLKHYPGLIQGRNCEIYTKWQNTLRLTCSLNLIPTLPAPYKSCVCAVSKMPGVLLISQTAKYWERFSPLSVLLMQSEPSAFLYSLHKKYIVTKQCNHCLCQVTAGNWVAMSSPFARVKFIKEFDY